MKILLIRPPQLEVDSLSSTAVGIPIGMLSIAGYINKKGHEVKIFDSLLYPDRIEDKTHYGASFERIGKTINEFKPDIIGIANLFSTQMKKALGLTEYIKSIYPDGKIVVGGPHATARPEEFLVSSSIDFVVIGEGEITLAEIAEYYDGKKDITEVNGIAYMKEGKLQLNKSEYIQDLDSIPYPAYHLVDLEEYFKMSKAGRGSRLDDIFHEPKREVSIITSRGCPYECIFCSIHPTMGYKFRYHSPEYVVGHIELLVKMYGVDFIHFEDDNLTLNQVRFEKILDMIIEKGLEFGWDTPNAVRADALSLSILKKVKQTHVRSLTISIESGNQEFLNNVVKKNLDIEKVIETASNCKKLRIPLHAYYIIGFPHETKENIQQTIDFAYKMMKNYNIKPHLNFAMPLVGTEMYDIAKENGYLVTEDYTKGRVFGTSSIKTEHFTPEDLKIFHRNFYKRVKNLYLMQMIQDPLILLRNVKIFLEFPKNTIRIAKVALKRTSQDYK
ncbi:MAG: radical SAM protein [bacterium]|nr:radical SAM protein [bacterium]